MRYVIVGAGAIGGILAARLAQHLDTPPLVIARGDNAAAIRSGGLLLCTPDGAVRVPAPVATGPDEATLTTDDVLVFATKTQQVTGALLEWVDRPVHGADGTVVGTAGDVLPVLTALNGVEAERLALRWFRRVYAVTIWIPGVHLRPGEFIDRFAPLSGVFIVGRYGTPLEEGEAAGDRALLDRVHADWEAATFRVHVVDNPMKWKYRKLISNLENAVQALLGPAEAERAPEAVARIQQLATDEGLRVLASAGIALPSDSDEASWRAEGLEIRPVPGVDEPLAGSSWQSLARGTGSIETDYLNGEIVRMARTVGLAAPVNETLQQLARRAAVERKGPGSMKAAELLAAVSR